MESADHLPLAQCRSVLVHAGSGPIRYGLFAPQVIEWIFQQPRLRWLVFERFACLDERAEVIATKADSLANASARRICYWGRSVFSDEVRVGGRGVDLLLLIK
ncbi:hypothetical protein [Limimaricola pyoseonensis]|uniref:hypothetical protein n=1 Tax=Limimaricola pyoseonensis TaxID=521013 RepID=UPI0010423E4E|nr:hypothetical protein [Limimaricola pyoseonensis]